jgi:ABC-type lipoprotein release transport system permease subunit
MFRLALHNLWRNPKRAGITLAAITVGVWALIFIWSFIDGINEQMISNNIRYLTGHIKIHQQGYHESKVAALSMPVAIPQAVAENGRIITVAPRVEGSALVSAGQLSATVMVYGVSPAAETKVTSLHQTITSGRYLSGQPLELVLGDNLARTMAVKVGDSMDIIVQAADGSIGADRFTIVGLFDSGINVLDESLIVLPVEDAQELYSLWGRYTAWVLSLGNRYQVDGVTRQLRENLPQGHEVYPWTMLLPSVVQAIAFHDAVAYVVLWIVFIVVAAGIANTLLMSVMERRHEFGVMMALGTQGGQIIALVLWESILLALPGLFTGNLVGIAFTAFWAEKGMDLSAYTAAMETMPGLSGIVYPLISGDHLLVIAAVVFAVSVLPALLPAWHASRLDPVKAMRGDNEESGMANRLEGLLPLPGHYLWLQLAWRNLFRYPKRSMLTGGAIAFGMASFIFLYAFADGFFEQMIDNSTQLLSADIQIKSDMRGSNEGVFNHADIATDILSQPEIAASSSRIAVKAMAGSAHKALPVDWIGIQPAEEVKLTKLHQLLIAGQFLDDETPGALIGKSLATELAVSIGQKIVITSQDEQGQLLSTAVRVKGIFFSGSEMFDRRYLFSPLAQVRRLFGYSADQISHLAIRLAERRDSVIVAQRLSAKLKGSPLTAKPWEQLMPVVVQMVAMTRVDFYLILAVIFVVVGMGVLNTTLMAVLERTREFGVILALGTQPAQILRVVLYEAALLGLMGLVAGIALGAMLVGLYHTQGMDLSAFMDSMAAIPGMTDRVYPVLIWQNLLLPIVMLYVLVIAVSVLPAVKAAKLQPVEAIYGR